MDFGIGESIAISAAASAAAEGAAAAGTAAAAAGTAAEVGAAAGAFSAAGAAGFGAEAGSAAGLAGGAASSSGVLSFLTSPGVASSLQLGSGAVSGIGSIMGGMSARQASQYQAAVASRNQQLADMQAQVALETGRSRSQINDLQTGQKVGRAIATAAAQGVDVSTGSPLETVADITRAGAIDSITIRNDAARQAYGFGVSSAGFAGEAEQARRAGSNQEIGGAISGAGSFLGGAAATAARAQRFKETGVDPWSFGQ